MNIMLEALAKILEVAGNLAAESTSTFLLYQPEKPECMKNEENEK